MQDADLGRPSGQGTDGRGLRVGLVRARFNDGITRALQAACEAELQRLGAEVTERVEVGGALELPLALQALAETRRFDALVALGCVIRGETYHFELVADQSGAGITRVALDHRLPIANVVLTVESLEQAQARIDKGRDAAQVAVEMARLLQRFRGKDAA